MHLKNSFVYSIIEKKYYFNFTCCIQFFSGKSVIGQKTELQKTFDKLREDQKKKELEEERLQKKSALERKLEEQANKLKQVCIVSLSKRSFYMNY